MTTIISFPDGALECSARRGRSGASSTRIPRLHLNFEFMFG